MRSVGRGIGGWLALAVALLPLARPAVADTAAWTPEELRILRSMWIGTLGPPPDDPSNAYDTDPRAAALGRRLFFDKRLSRNGKIACATCHQPALGFQDGKPVAEGLGRLTRRSMPLAGVGQNTWFFWDGRKDSLWSQALAPIENPLEFGMTRAETAMQIVRHYRADYEAIFGPIPAGGGETDDENATKRVFVNVGKTLSPALRIDGGLRYEFSHLTVGGDGFADRRLKFLKPSLTVDWKPGGNWHTQFSIKRTVAQLNFFDFTTAAEISADRVNAGNENLEPQRAWEFRATADHPLFGEGLAKLELGYDLISMLQDRVLIEDPETHRLFDAPGNLGTGRHAFARLTLDAPLGRYWKGLRVKFTGTVRRTRVEDPITHEMRNFSDYFPNWEWNVDVRRDSGPFSYGFVISDYRHFTFFRTDEFDTNFNGGPFGTAFIEYRPGPRTSITLDLDNALRTSGNRHRIRYFDDRADPTPFIIDEFRERNRHWDFGLTLKRTFGGGGTQVAAAAAPAQ